MKKTFCIFFLSLIAFSAKAQWDNGVLLDVQEVDIAGMKALKMPGAEAVMKVIEQYADGKYRYVFVSNNYLIPEKQKGQINTGRNRFIVAVAGYPALNDLIYTQVLFDKSFFFVVMAKNESDMKKSNNMQIIKMNYEKRNAVRRNNVRDTIQRNNIIPLGIDAERY